MAAVAAEAVVAGRLLRVAKFRQSFRRGPLDRLTASCRAGSPVISSSNHLPGALMVWCLDHVRCKMCWLCGSNGNPS